MFCGQLPLPRRARPKNQGAAVLVVVVTWERWTKSREISGNFDGLLMDNYCWTIVGLILMEIEMELDNNFCWGILNYLMCLWISVFCFFEMIGLVDHYEVVGVIVF